MNKKKDKPICKTYVFGKDTERVVTLVVKVFLVKDTVGYRKADYAVAIGYAICRPGDTVSKIGETIARGRADKDIEDCTASALIMIKPSIKTIESLAQDFYHYMLNNPEDFYVHSKKSKREEQFLEQKKLALEHQEERKQSLEATEDIG